MEFLKNFSAGANNFSKGGNTPFPPWLRAWYTMDHLVNENSCGPFVDHLVCSAEWRLTFIEFFLVFKLRQYY